MHRPAAVTSTYLLSTQPTQRVETEISPASRNRKRDTSTSLLGKAGLALGLTVVILAVSVLVLITMRIKYGQSFKSLFSRRSKGRKAKGPSMIRDDTDSSTSASSSASTFRPPRLQSIRLSKELEILGLLTDPRIAMEETASPASWLSSSPVSTLNARASPLPSPSPSYSLFPTVQRQLVPDPYWKDYENDDDGYDTEREQALTSKENQASYPVSPLLPPPPSLLLQPRSPSREHFPAPSPEADPGTGAPLSPALSYRTFATRSSGIFPWGTEPHAVDVEEDVVSEVLVLPSPPQFAHSYGYERRAGNGVN
ncbi:uncharacterized protein DSM5745_06623 [Aspergillus mulundensis]|uniref:Uncharacterized protein n=1 Tax=Aspergillus mulundensis TaxID=1810919 RepID=A0A3D8RS29_9EURO|nr:Uncharacterized protein DSM5745_06623 [Aspergillus mulundensis]RDW76631.1 Uncharacterized protein DSM5745_06623 [Aspergillus mulundensis]